MSQKFFQEANIAAGFVPVDMQTAANDGDWINLASYGRCVAVLYKAAGTAGQDPVFTLEQATTAAGGSSKALTFTTIYSKVGTLTAIADWTKTTQTAAGTYTDTVSAEAQAIIAVEINAADLDVDNGFKFMRITIPDTGGNAQLGCAFYILLDPRDGGTSMPSAIA